MAHLDRIKDESIRCRQCVHKQEGRTSRTEADAEAKMMHVGVYVRIWMRAVLPDEKECQQCAESDEVVHAGILVLKAGLARP